MLKLESLQLENFQCHGSTTVSFSPTITTIKGPSDVGKSSILRALGWVCQNNIPGDEFIKEGEKETTVSLTLSTGEKKVKVVRRRTRYENTYELDGEEYKAFGQSAVPEDIASLLQLNNINFQNQHDSPFWFNESAPEVSRRLNAVVDLTVIDTALSNIASAVRQAQEKVSFIDERIVEAKTKLEELEPQKARIEEFKTLKEEHERFTKYKKDCDQMVSTINRGRECKNRQRDLEEKSTAGRDVLGGLREVLDLKKSCEELAVTLNEARRLQGIEPPPDFNVVESTSDQWKKLDVRVDSLTWFIKRLVDALTKADEWKEKSRLAEKRFHERVKDQTCPLCGNKL